MLSDVGVYLSWLNSKSDTGALTRMGTVFLYNDLKIVKFTCRVQEDKRRCA